MARVVRPGGVEERGMYERVTQEPGRARPLHTQGRGEGTAITTVQGRPVQRPEQAAAKRGRRGVEPPSEGNEARRGGEQSEPLNSTGEAGEPTPGDPAEERRRLA